MVAGALQIPPAATAGTASTGEVGGRPRKVLDTEVEDGALGVATAMGAVTTTVDTTAGRVAPSYFGL